MNAPARINAANARSHTGFTAQEYAEMVASGAFGDLRVELLGGELRKMMPSDWAHSESNARLTVLLSQAYLKMQARVGTDVTIMLSDDTVRAGDIVVVRPGFTGKRLTPEDVLLVVEIASTTLSSDLGDKSIAYAAAGIPECWVVDVNGASVHVMTEPGIDGYGRREVLRFGEQIAVPGAGTTIAID